MNTFTDVPVSTQEYSDLAVAVGVDLARHLMTVRLGYSDQTRQMVARFLTKELK